LTAAIDMQRSPWVRVGCRQPTLRLLIGRRLQSGLRAKHSKRGLRRLVVTIKGQRKIRTNKRLAAERQIHAAIEHYSAGEFECVISLCSAAEGLTKEPEEPTHLFGILKNYITENRFIDRKEYDFNFISNWMKHTVKPDEVEIEEWMATMWLNRAISKYRAVYGSGTPEMTALFPWSGNSRSRDF